MMPHYKNKSVISSATELFQKTQVQSGNKKKKILALIIKDILSLSP